MARALRFHGSRDKQSFEYVGYNSRLDELQSAILRVLLRRPRRLVDGRRAAAARLRSRWDRRPRDGCPVVPDGAAPAWHLYVVTHPRADQLISGLRERGIQARGYYRTPLHRQVAMAPYAAGPELPATDAIGRDNIALPMSPVLSEAQAREVVGALAGWPARPLRPMHGEDHQ